MASKWRIWRDVLIERIANHLDNFGLAWQEASREGVGQPRFDQQFKTAESRVGHGVRKPHDLNAIDSRRRSYRRSNRRFKVLLERRLQ